jgi:hypothetical protein
LQLYREVKFLTQKNHLIQIIVSHVDSATLDDGVYELTQEPEQGFSEDQVNIAEDLTEARTKVQKSLTSLTPAPLKKASPDA